MDNLTQLDFWGTHAILPWKAGWRELYLLIALASEEGAKQGHKNGCFPTSGFFPNLSSALALKKTLSLQGELQ